MDERDLDRAIDMAAGELIAREPSRALSANVMARVRRERPLATRRFLWAAAAAAGIALCAATAVSLMDRVPATVVKLPETMQLPVGRPALTPAPPVIAAQSTAPARPRSVVPQPRIVPPNETTAKDLSPIEPIETEPIVMSAIELPQLEREATLIDTLDIEPLAIAPLATSND